MKKLLQIKCGDDVFSVKQKLDALPGVKKVYICTCEEVHVYFNPNLTTKQRILAPFENVVSYTMLEKL